MKHGVGGTMIGLWLRRRALLLALMAIGLAPAAAGGGDVWLQSGKRLEPAGPDAARFPRFLAESEPQSARWERHLSYYRQLDRRSDRLELSEIGRTPHGRPLVLLTISSPANLRDQERLRSLQRRLADPRQMGTDTLRARLVEEGRLVILITGRGNQFDTSVANTSGQGPLQVIADLLHHLLTAQSPDVLRILEETLILVIPSIDPDGIDGYADQPSSSRNYAAQGVDDDLDAFTRIETRILADKVLTIWHPRVWSESGQSDPVAPPGPDRVLISSLLARLIAPPGAKVQTCDRSSDAAFWSRQHAGIHLLAQFDPPPLAGPREDSAIVKVIDRQVAATVTLLSLAAVRRLELTRRLVELAQTRPQRRPFAYLLPEPVVPDSISRAYQQLSQELSSVAGVGKERHDQAEALYDGLSGDLPSESEIGYYYRTEGLDRILAILKRGGVEVRRASRPFFANRRQWPAGTHFVRLAEQPYGGFAGAILDPAARCAGMPARSLPLLLNVKVVRVDQVFNVESKPEPTAVVLQDRIRENGGVRVGVYADSESFADADWTRRVFDQYRFGHQAVGISDLQDTRVGDRFDAIVIPDRSDRQPEPTTAGGLSGEVERRALLQFVEAGGTIVAFNRASRLLVDLLSLPVRTLNPRGVAGGAVARSWRNGAILRLTVDSVDPLCLGMGRESVAWFEDGPIFEITDPRRARVVARFARTGPLALDGSLASLARLRGRGALIEVRVGRGRVILFAFRPQYHGRSLVTLPFLFNALLTSGRAAD